MDWSESAYDRSFRDRMQEGMEAATGRDYSRRRAVIVTTRPRLTEWWTAEQVATAWGVNVSQVKAVLGRGSVKGARRLKTGKGRPWAIPAKLQPDGSYQVERTRGRRGPPPRLALSPADPVPF